MYKNMKTWKYENMKLLVPGALLLWNVVKGDVPRPRNEDVNFLGDGNDHVVFLERWVVGGWSVGGRWVDGRRWVVGGWKGG